MSYISDENPDEDKEGKDDNQSTYKSQKSGGGGEDEEGENAEVKPKSKQKQNMDFVNHQFTDQTAFQMNLISGQYNCGKPYFLTY